LNKQKILKVQIDLRQTIENCDPIKVADLNVGLPGLVTVGAWTADNKNKSYPYPTQWFAFERGDEIIVDATMSNKNGTNTLTVFSYPDQVTRYSNNAFTELKGVRIKVEQRSIFGFVLGTNHTFDRNCFLKIYRKPASKETISFNSAVSLQKFYTPVAIHEAQDFFINGGWNATLSTGRSRVTIPIILPENTVEWYYRFSASRDKADIENVKKNFNLLSEVTTSMFGMTGVGTVFTDAIFSSLAQPPGADVCEIYLLGPEHREAFEAKKDDQWRYFTEGARQNFKSGNVRITSFNAGQFYLGIRNPASTMGINVSVEVVALTVKEEYVMESDDR
jgi:hypothetical protein